MRISEEAWDDRERDPESNPVAEGVCQVVRRMIFSKTCRDLSPQMVGLQVERLDLERGQARGVAVALDVRVMATSLVVVDPVVNVLVISLGRHHGLAMGEIDLADPATVIAQADPVMEITDREDRVTAIVQVDLATIRDQLDRAKVAVANNGDPVTIDRPTWWRKLVGTSSWLSPRLESME
jgi:hypothetical protein